MSFPSFHSWLSGIQSQQWCLREWRVISRLPQISLATDTDWSHPHSGTGPHARVAWSWKGRHGNLTSRSSSFNKWVKNLLLFKFSQNLKQLVAILPNGSYREGVFFEGFHFTAWFDWNKLLNKLEKFTRWGMNKHDCSCQTFVIEFFSKIQLPTFVNIFLPVSYNSDTWVDIAGELKVDVAAFVAGHIDDIMEQLCSFSDMDQVSPRDYFTRVSWAPYWHLEKK